MPKNAARKKAARARMAATGDNYTRAARAAQAGDLPVPDRSNQTEALAGFFQRMFRQPVRPNRGPAPSPLLAAAQVTSPGLTVIYDAHPDGLAGRQIAEHLAQQIYDWEPHLSGFAVDPRGGDRWNVVASKSGPDADASGFADLVVAMSDSQEPDEVAVVFWTPDEITPTVITGAGQALRSAHADGRRLRLVLLVAGAAVHGNAHRGLYPDTDTAILAGGSGDGAAPHGGWWTAPGMVQVINTRESDPDTRTVGLPMPGPTPRSVFTLWLSADANLAQPYPFYVAGDGTVGQQEFWRGDPIRCLGFQRGDIQRVVLWWADAIKDGLQGAVGLRPVFVSSGGSMWSHQQPVKSVDWALGELPR